MIKSFLIYDKKFRENVTNLNINLLNYLGETSLHMASEMGHQSVVQLLLDRGSNIDRRNDNGE